MTSNPVRPKVLVFDVNGTLSDLDPMRARFEQVGLPGHLMQAWFDRVLRDGFALSASGRFGKFADLAEDGLRALLSDAGGAGGGGTDEAVRHVLAGFDTLDVHPDVPAGVHALRACGYRLLTMTNGSIALTDRLLDRAGLRDCFDAVLDVAGARCWKPCPGAYRWAVQQADVSPAQAMLVAVHPWDVHGAVQAGLTGAWLRRGASAAAYPRAFNPPTLTATDLVELARLIC